MAAQARHPRPLGRDAGRARPSGLDCDWLRAASRRIPVLHLRNPRTGCLLKLLNLLKLRDSRIAGAEPLLKLAEAAALSG